MIKEQISNFKQVKDIMWREGGFAREGIKLEFDSKIPLFFDYSKFPSSLTIKKEEYESAISYIENILDEHASYYDNTRNIVKVKGVCEYSGVKKNKCKTYKIKLEQTLETMGVAKRPSSKLLDISISFQTGSRYSFLNWFNKVK